MRFLSVAAGALAVLCATAAAQACAPDRCAALVVAQAGGAGGTIGVQDKSISGGEERQERAAPRAAAPVRREARRAPAERSVSFDGVWSSTAAGEGACAGSVNGVVTISKGRIFAQGVSGTVTGSGAVHMVVVGNGMTAVGSGHMAGNLGSGRFRRSDGCVGHWSVVRQ